MNIHHTHQKQAEKIGVVLSVIDDEVEAFWPEYNQTVTAANAKEALEAMREVQDTLRAAEQEGGNPDVPEEEENEEGEEEDSTEDSDDEDNDGDDDGDEEEGDETDGDEEGEEKLSSSVVKEKYRAKYAEEGHPAHCGDWLAEFLNNQILTKAGADIERFKRICELNEVDMSKYRTSGQGWQGRYRMTGRNLLAKKLFERDVVLSTDMDGNTVEFPVPEYWKMEQRFQK